MMNEYEIEELLKQPYNADDVNPPETQDKSTSWTDDKYYEALIPLLKEYEGFRGQVYIPTPGDKPTLGYGHAGKKAIPGATISEPEASELLKQDAKERTEVIQGMIPGFKELPLETAVQLGQSAFRGGITGSPKTIEYINAGEFEKASEEFLDNDEYRNAEATGRPGIRKRMEAVSKALKPGTGVTPAANMSSGNL